MSLLLLLRNDVGATPAPPPAPTVFFGSSSLAWGGNSTRKQAQARDAEIKALLEIAQQKQLSDTVEIKPRKLKLSGKSFEQQFKAKALPTDNEQLTQPIVISDQDFDIDLMLYLFTQTF